MFFIDFKNAWIYPVTTVDKVPVAISILSKEKEKVDMMIIYVHSLYSLCFNLLKQVDALDIVSRSIGSSNSNFCMSFNSGVHHDYNLNSQTQNYYILDLNNKFN
ncbi:hypothetical protein RDI58_000757 [Solanum bulbocastanum]|uniref:Uncharacterized protein n=1 Tax=Solanum bulbocastanum TaxID=147425 RepID=A0AAN8U6S2_SOLBU